MAHQVKRWTDFLTSVGKVMLFNSGDAGQFVHIDDPELLISSFNVILKDYADTQK